MKPYADLSSQNTRISPALQGNSIHHLNLLYILIGYFLKLIKAQSFASKSRRKVFISPKQLDVRISFLLVLIVFLVKVFHIHNGIFKFNVTFIQKYFGPEGFVHILCIFKFETNRPLSSLFKLFLLIDYLMQF